MTEERSFYIYMFFRPWNGEPCYVGKGKGDRINEHLRLAKSGKHYNKHLERIFRKALWEVPKVIVHERLTNQEAFDIEIDLIKTIGRKAHGGPLVNMTDGGDGIRNMDDDLRKRISAALTGKKLSDERRREISIRHKASAKVALNIANLAKARKGTKMSEGQRARMSQARKGIIFSPEHRANLSEGQRRRKHDSFTPEQLARRREKTKDYVVSAETREKNRQGAIRQHARQRERKMLAEKEIQGDLFSPECLTAKGAEALAEARRKAAAG